MVGYLMVTEQRELKSVCRVLFWRSWDIDDISLSSILGEKANRDSRRDQLWKCRNRFYCQMSIAWFEILNLVRGQGGRQRFGRDGCQSHNQSTYLLASPGRLSFIVQLFPEAEKGPHWYVWRVGYIALQLESGG